MRRTLELPPFVSVVVIGYNQQDLAPLAVKSVLNQTHERLECIFVDDGSKDSTFDHVSAMSQLDARLKAYRKKNGGPSSARNFGVAKISPSVEFIAFLDGDDLFKREFIAAGLQYLRENPSVGVVIPSREFIDQDGVPLEGQRRGFRWVPSTLGMLPRRLKETEPATPFVTFYCGTGAAPFWLARRSAYEKTEGWDVNLWHHEDADILCQLAMVTTVHIIPNRFVQYRIHAPQITQAGTASPPSHTGGLNDLQEKWNGRRYADPEKNRTLDRACLYYRQIHLPFRALWVARRALGEFFQSPSLRRAAWLCSLVWLFLRDFMYFKMFPWRSQRRYIATRFYEATGRGQPSLKVAAPT